MRQPFVWKSVVRRMGRYGVLVSMIALGIAAVTLVQAVTVGMTATVVEGSARYLGGRFVVIARRDHGYATNRIEHPDALVAALSDAGIQPSLVVRREVAGDNDPTLFFNGTSFRVRRVSGIDFAAEAAVFDQLAFSAGGPPTEAGGKGILISRQVAQRFGVRVGDELTLRLVNNAGFLDSATLVVQGIFRDASIFGYYNCYVDFEVLRSLLGEQPGSCNAMGFYFDDHAASAVRVAGMENALANAGFQLFPPLKSRSDLQSYWDKNWDGVRYGILPVENYIDDKVMDLIHAIQLISYLFLVLILLVIMVGIRNTTQIMTRKRFKEIGTIRALGMSRTGAQRMVLRESVLVASLGFASGLALAVLILLALQLVPLDLSDGFDIFLRKGHLSWQLSPLFIAVNYLALTLMTVAGSLPAARRAASISPASAIATND